MGHFSRFIFGYSPQFPPGRTVSDTGEGSKVIPSILRANPLLNFASILYSGQTPLLWGWADLNSAESGIAGVGLALIFMICLAIPHKLGEELLLTTRIDLVGPMIFESNSMIVGDCPNPSLRLTYLFPLPLSSRDGTIFASLFA